MTILLGRGSSTLAARIVNGTMTRGPRKKDRASFQTAHVIAPVEMSGA
jgi:hypothetical protein